MFKEVGVVMVAGSIGLYGWWRAALLRQRRELLEAMEQYWTQFSLQLEHLGRTPGEIAELLAALEEFKGLPFACQLAEQLHAVPDFSGALKRTLTALGWEADREVTAPLIPLMDTIGRFGLEIQQTALSAAIQLFHRAAKQALEKEQRYGLLYRRLGLLCGCLAAVILL